MSLKLNENLKELEEIYKINEKTPNPLYKTKFGSVTSYQILSETEPKEKQYIIRRIEPTKEHKKTISKYIEALQNFQAYNKKECRIQKIVALYHSPNDLRYYFVQRDYMKLSNRLNKLKEIDLFHILREVCRLYHSLLTENADFSEFFVNNLLAIQSIALENISYYKKISKNGFKKWKLKVDFLNFHKEEEEFQEENLERLHIASFKKLVLGLFFEEKMDKPISDENYFPNLIKVVNESLKKREFGLISRNFINALFNPKQIVKWSDMVQHPVLKIDILVTSNVNMWEIDRKRDSEICNEWLNCDQTNELKKSQNYAPNEDSESNSSNDRDYTTQKRNCFKKAEVEGPIEIEKTVQNVEVHDDILESSGGKDHKIDAESESSDEEKKENAETKKNRKKNHGLKKTSSSSSEDQKNKIDSNKKSRSDEDKKPKTKKKKEEESENDGEKTPKKSRNKAVIENTEQNKESPEKKKSENDKTSSSSSEDQKKKLDSNKKSGSDEDKKPKTKKKKEEESENDGEKTPRTKKNKAAIEVKKNQESPEKKKSENDKTSSSSNEDQKKKLISNKKSGSDEEKKPKTKKKKEEDREGDLERTIRTKKNTAKNVEKNHESQKKNSDKTSTSSNEDQKKKIDSNKKSGSDEEKKLKTKKKKEEDREGDLEKTIRTKKNNAATENVEKSQKSQEKPKKNQSENVEKNLKDQKKERKKKGNPLLSNKDEDLSAFNEDNEGSEEETL